MRVYDEHGIFLFPSFFEGFGKAFLEAMSRGLVVLASNNGGMRDVIKNGQNGFLFKTGDCRQMADFAIQLVANSDLAGRISKEARKSSLSYSWHRVAIETASFYECHRATELLDRRSRTMFIKPVSRYRKRIAS